MTTSQTTSLPSTPIRVLTLILAGFLVVSIDQPAAAASRETPQITVKATSKSITAGATVSLSGRVSKVKSRDKITITRRVGRKWRAVKSIKTTKRGRFTYTFTPAVGTASYRIEKKATRELKAARSRTVTISAIAGPATPTAPLISTKSLPDAQVGRAYRQVLRTTDGRQGEWSVTSGALPGGLVLSSAGELTGAPLAAGVGTFVVTFVDGRRQAVDQSLTLTIAPAGRTVLVSKNVVDGWRGVEPSLTTSGDGRYVAYSAYVSNATQIYVWDRVTDTRTLVSKNTAGAAGRGESSSPTISDDGRYVAFASHAPDLVPVDTNGGEDVFLWDRASDTRVLVSEIEPFPNDPEDSWGPSISADGRYISFTSSEPGLVPGDTNGAIDIFSWERLTGETVLVSNATDGGPSMGQGNHSSISGDGRFVAFESYARDLAAGDRSGTGNVFLWDRVTDKTVLASKRLVDGTASGEAMSPSVSDDGRYVAFVSAATTITTWDTNLGPDVFLWDQVADTTSLISVAPDGGPANGGGSDPSVSADGRFVAFASNSPDLVAGDVNQKQDVFLRDRLTGTTALVSSDAAEAPANSESLGAALSADGRFVSFLSRTQLVDASSLREASVLTWDRLGGA